MNEYEHDEAMRELRGLHGGQGDQCASCDDALANLTDYITTLEAANARLRAVVEAARGLTAAAGDFEDSYSMSDMLRRGRCPYRVATRRHGGDDMSDDTAATDADWALVRHEMLGECDECGRIEECCDAPQGKEPCDLARDRLQARLARAEAVCEASTFRCCLNDRATCWELYPNAVCIEWCAALDRWQEARHG